MSTLQTQKQTVKENRGMCVLTVYYYCAPSHSCQDLSAVCFDSLYQVGGGFVCFYKLTNVGCQYLNFTILIGHDPSSSQIIILVLKLAVKYLASSFTLYVNLEVKM